MAQPIMIKHPTSGMIKTGYYSYLFFGWWVPLWRGELGVAALHFLFTWLTFFAWQIVLSFLYNKQYMTRMLVDKGYTLADDENRNAEARQRLRMAPPSTPNGH